MLKYFTGDIKQQSHTKMIYQIQRNTGSCLVVLLVTIIYQL